MGKIRFASKKSDWRFWLMFGFGVAGAVLVLVGFIANMVAMSDTLGYISFLAFVTWHWSFWLVVSGAIILVSLLIAKKIFGKKSKKEVKGVSNERDTREG